MYLQEQKFVGGSQQLSDKLAETLDGSVKLSCPVVSIKQTETEVQLTDKHGRTYTVSMLLSNIQFCNIIGDSWYEEWNLRKKNLNIEGYAYGV
jgi:protoporphyrinogen oxidase